MFLNRGNCFIGLGGWTPLHRITTKMIGRPPPGSSSVWNIISQMPYVSPHFGFIHPKFSSDLMYSASLFAVDAIDELKNGADKQTNDASKAELEKQVKALTDRHQQLINEMDMIRGTFVIICVVVIIIDVYHHHH